jgi:hypothetical protein
MTNLVTPRNCDVLCPNVCASLRGTGTEGTGSGASFGVGTGTEGGTADDRSGMYMDCRSQDLMPEMDMEPSKPAVALYIGAACIGPVPWFGVHREYWAWPWCGGMKWWLLSGRPVQCGGGGALLMSSPMTPPPPPPPPPPR